MPTHKPTCSKCNRGFIGRSAKVLQSDVQSCAIHKCNLCDKNFSSKKGLKAHIPTHKPTCPKCDRVFSGKSAEALLNEHLTVIICTPKHICQYCNAGFGTKFKLNYHLTQCNKNENRCNVWKS